MVDEDEIEYLGIYESEKNGVLYIEHDDEFIYAGTGTNWGSTRQYKHKIDTDFSIDENLQAFIEDMEDE